MRRAPSGSSKRRYRSMSLGIRSKALSGSRRRWPSSPSVSRSARAKAPPCSLRRKPPLPSRRRYEPIPMVILHCGTAIPTTYENRGALAKMKTSLVFVFAFLTVSQAEAQVSRFPKEACDRFADGMGIRTTAGFDGISRKRLLDWCSLCVEHVGSDGQVIMRVCPQDPAPECDDRGCHFEKLNEWRTPGESGFELERRAQEFRTK
jgi:hypothetical protein